MDAIWIIIIIIAVIMRFLKVEDVKGKLPEEWGLPWDDEPELDQELPQKQPVRIQSEVAKQEEPVTTGLGSDSNMNESNLKNLETAFVEHPLLNTDTVISGLIMSELLQPPKSKRPGWRNS